MNISEAFVASILSYPCGYHGDVTNDGHCWPDFIWKKEKENILQEEIAEISF